MALDPVTSVLNIGNTLIERLWPDPAVAAHAKMRLAELDKQGAFAELQGQLQLNQSQAAVNAVEAKSPHLWVSGWRPAIGWIGAAALGYSFLVLPVLRWILIATGTHVATGDLPVLDMSQLLTIVLGMLGLVGVHGYENVNGAEHQ